MTLFCGFLVLAPSMAHDGRRRRPPLGRRLLDRQPAGSGRGTRGRSSTLYFGVLLCYAAFGLVMLSINKPLQLLKIATNIMNFALGFSCFHTLDVNTTLLPPASCAPAGSSDRAVVGGAVLRRPGHHRGDEDVDGRAGRGVTHSPRAEPAGCSYE